MPITYKQAAQFFNLGPEKKTKKRKNVKRAAKVHKIKRKHKVVKSSTTSKRKHKVARVQKRKTVARKSPQFIFTPNQPTATNLKRRDV